ncbi:MAG: M28 family peptidase, partial [Planctomycetes bacterium]|nr:M28 family peptidase [Planctomycetota bacterium]
MATRTSTSLMGVILLTALSGPAAWPGAAAARAPARELAAAAAIGALASPPALPRTVSAAEIEATVRAINIDRTSSRDGEKKAAAYLEQKLKEYGVKATRYDVKAFLSWPVKSELMVRLGEPWAIPAVTPAFGASTPPGGLTAEIVFAPAQPESPGWAPPGVAMRDRILVVPGLVSPESVLRAQEIGAAGLIHISEGEALHEMIATTIWGTPTTASAARLPRIPVLSIGKMNGDRMRSAAARGPVIVKMVAEVDRGWATIPLVVADVPGTSAEFILVTTHIDSWYEGVTDTAGTVASLLEMARVLQGQQATFRRGIRFAWWPGHSTGRYAGSSWYVDHFWSDLDRNCVAYTNADIIGVRGSRVGAVEAGGWPGLAEYSVRFARSLKAELMPAATNGLFRPGRDSDSSFQGIGIPEFFVRVPGPPRGHPDLEAGGRLTYWHTKDDTLDKLDFQALALDAQHRVAQIADLATLAVLPHEIGPVVRSYVKALDSLTGAAGDRFDLSSTRAAAATLATVAERLDAAPRPTRAASIAELNRLLVHVTHVLNAGLYSGAGRFNQDPAAPTPILPALAGVR